MILAGYYQGMPIYCEPMLGATSHRLTCAVRLALGIPWEDPKPIVERWQDVGTAMTAQRLREAMEEVWLACSVHGGPGPEIACIPGGLWLRRDGAVSDDAHEWRERTEADQGVIDRWRRQAGLP